MTRPPKATRLLNRSLMHTAARLHYLDGLSQLEVSRRMEVSTATVSRLLGLARDEGIVRIQVVDLDDADVLGEKLAAALALKAVRVIDGARAAALSAEVGALLLGAGLAPGAVLTIGWGRTVQSVIAAGLPRVPGLVVVPATGGMNETASHFQINEFMRKAAAQLGAEARFLHAPSIVSAELRAVLAETPDARARIDEAALGVVKAGVVRDLGNKASCVLLDAVCAVPGVVDQAVLGRDTGLLVGLDASGWDVDAAGYRISKLVAGGGCAPGARARRDRGQADGLSSPRPARGECHQPRHHPRLHRRFRCAGSVAGGRDPDLSAGRRKRRRLSRGLSGADR